MFGTQSFTDEIENRGGSTTVEISKSSMDKTNFGEWYVECVVDALVKLREAREVKQSELAERLGVGQPVISRIENRESELKMPMFYNWCIALQSKPEDVARAARAIAVYRHQGEPVFVEMLKSWINYPSDDDSGSDDLLNESFVR